jgi:hypothetical protein
MRNSLLLLLMILALCFLALPSLSERAVKASGVDDFPCNPSPKEVRACQNSGGTFNFGSCRCEYP